MKIVQTLGKHQGYEGAFAYRRTSRSVEIDTTINARYKCNPARVRIRNSAWNSFLRLIESQRNETFRITRATAGAQPRQSLHTLIARHFVGNNWAHNDSIGACIVAILEHEGVVDLYHGPLGRNNVAIITLSRS